MRLGLRLELEAGAGGREAGSREAGAERPRLRLSL